MKKVTPLIIAIAVLIVLAAWAALRQHYTAILSPVSHQTSDQPCLDYDKFVATATGVLPSSIKLNRQDVTSEAYASLLWRQTSQEPYRGYTPTRATALTSPGLKLSDINSRWVVEAGVRLAMQGFVTDPTQQTIEKEFGGVVYGFNKGQDHYLLEAGPGSDVGSLVAYVTCGRADNSADAVYTKVISHSQFQSDTQLRLDHQDGNLYEILVHAGFFGGGGFTQYWYINGDQIVKLSEGQDAPECTLFELYKVGRGLDCMDSKTHQPRTVNY